MFSEVRRARRHTGHEELPICIEGPREVECAEYGLRSWTDRRGMFGVRSTACEGDTPHRGRLREPARADPRAIRRAPQGVGVRLAGTALQGRTF